MRVLGLDPGLRHTGWGVVEADGVRLRYVADGAVHSDALRSLAERLGQLHAGLVAVIAEYRPDEAAVEETFVNKNPASTLKLGLARGVALLVPARAGLAVAEYSANLVKKSVVGADALAVAICHAHHAGTERRWHAAAGEGDRAGRPGGTAT